MTKLIWLKCGCIANSICSKSNGQTFNPPVPSCVAHRCIEVADEQPNLTGRRAQCSYGDSEKDSSYSLISFEYSGPGSYRATEICSCGYAKKAHEPGKGHSRICSNFKAAGPQKFDRYYCGCYGIK